MLPDKVPNLSLGWDVLDWGSTYLAQPDGENMGDAWHYTKEQALFILHFYAVDEHGKFLYRRALIERAKGWGKSPLLAAICATELLGPVTFDGFDANGNPVGKPFPTPLIQIAAVSEAQTDNTMSLIIEMLKQGEAGNEYYLDIGLSRVLSDHGRLEPVTANAKSREGQRPTFAVLDETHLWVPSNHGDKLAQTIRRNLGKVRGRSIETTNAYVPGEGSVAEDSHAYYESIKAGLAVNPGFLYDTRSAPPGTPYKGPERRAGLVIAYGSSAQENGGHVDLDRIEQEMDDPATKEADGRRFYFNQIVKGYSQWLDPQKWEALHEEKNIRKGDRIALGFDGSVRNDSTALVGCRLSDGHLFLIEVWEKPDDVEEWEVPFLLVDKKVRETLDEYDVAWMYADPAYWQDIVGRWALDYEETIYEYWTSRKSVMAKAVERFETAIYLGQISWDGEDLSRHVLNAHVEETPHGPLIKKEFPQSKRKIDAAMAAILALEARADAIEDGRLEDTSSDNFIYSF